GSRRETSSRSTASASASRMASTPRRSLARSRASCPWASGVRSFPAPALAAGAGPSRAGNGRPSEEIRRVHAACGQERAKLPQARGLDLPHALAGEAEAPADRLERLGRLPLEAEAAAQDQPLVLGQIVEYGYQLRALPEERADGAARVAGRIGDEIGHAALPFAAWRLEGDGVPADLLELLRLLATGAGAPAQLRLLLARQERDPRDLPQVDTEVLAAGLARLVPDVLVHLVGQRVERLVGDDVLGIVTHRADCRPSPPRAQSGAGAAGGRADYR